jgi:hypothetical protein
MAALEANAIQAANDSFNMVIAPDLFYHTLPAIILADGCGRLCDLDHININFTANTGRLHAERRQPRARFIARV